jgi:hypothetical protein
MVTTHDIVKTKKILPAYKMPHSENVTKILEELDALEKNIVQNWNITYPTLYSFLLTTITDLCAALHCPVPAQIGICFEGVNSQQAIAQIMTDSSTHLYVGSKLIKRSLLDDADEKAASAYRSFRWIIAHELGHLCDPKFKIFAQSFVVRNIIDKIAKVYLGLGIIKMLFPVTQAVIFIHPNFIVAVGAFIVLKKIMIILLHRSFEYSADKIALRGLPEFDIKDMQNALDDMITAIKPLLYADPTNKLNLLVGKNFPSIKNSVIYKKILEASIFYLHPSRSKRIRRILKSL